MGFGDRDVGPDPSARLLDALVVKGEPDHVRDRVRAQFAAGADHLCLRPIGVDGEATLEQIEELGEIASQALGSA
jgi:hypothetical protein